MGEWQRNELAGETDLAYVIVMHANLESQPPTPSNLDRWQSELNFTADAMLLDPGRSVIDEYINANPGPLYTQAVTVILDRDMVIRKVGSTYDTDHSVNLALLQEILAE